MIPNVPVVQRYIVGREGNPPVRLASFATLEEVYAFQETLDQDALHAGQYYIDDLESGES